MDDGTDDGVTVRWVSQSRSIDPAKAAAAIIAQSNPHPNPTVRLSHGVHPLKPAARRMYIHHEMTTTYQAGLLGRGHGRDEGAGHGQAAQGQQGASPQHP